MSQATQLVAFAGRRRIGTGTPLELAAAIKSTMVAELDAQILVFETETGRQTELDLRGTDAEIQERLRQQFGNIHPEASACKPGKGRPRLGVVAREVTLLPRHWDWLASRPGGASVMLRKLVEQAMRDPDAEAQRRREAAYRFMHALAGNEPGFEEASRALFAGNDAALRTVTSGWPADVQQQILSMLASAASGAPG